MIISEWMVYLQEYANSVFTYTTRRTSTRDTRDAHVKLSYGTSQTSITKNYTYFY